MSGLPEESPCPSRLVADVTVVFRHRLLTQPTQDAREHFSQFMEELRPHLPELWRDVAEKFAGTTYEFGKRSCSIILLESDTSIYVEVFAEDLSIERAVLAMRYAEERSHVCGTYWLCPGRAIWVKFDRMTRP